MTDRKRLIVLCCAALCAILALAFVFYSASLTNSVRIRPLAEKEFASMQEAGFGPMQGACVRYRADGQIKSLRCYVEAYHKGVYKGAEAKSVGNLQGRTGELFFAYAPLYDKSGNWLGMDWIRQEKSGALTVSKLEFPPELECGAMYASAPETPILGGWSKAFAFVSEQPVTLYVMTFSSPNAGMAMHSAKELREDPALLSQYEYAFVLKCVFSAQDEAALVNEASYELLHVGENGALQSEIAFPSGEQNALAEEIVMNAMLKSAAWPGVDPSVMPEHYIIRRSFGYEAQDYYAYILADGPVRGAVLQCGPDGMYSRIDDALYEALAAAMESATPGAE